MRYDSRVTLVSLTSGYDPDLGQTVEKETNKLTLPANVNSTGIRQSQLLFGGVKVDSVTIRFPKKIDYTKFNYVDYNGKRYKALTIQDCTKTNVLITTEVIS